jgi:PKD repeat protein
MRKSISSLLFLFALFCMGSLLQAQSPCNFNGIHPVCLEDTTLDITYHSCTGSVTAQPFLGSNAVGCLSLTLRPAWFYVKIAHPGNLLIYIEQFSLANAAIDVDFACWGPFPTTDVPTFLTNLCDGTYSLFTSTSGHPGSHHPANGDHSNHQTGGWPYPANATGNNIPMTDCSYAAEATEWCYIPDAQAGQIYLLMVTNFNGNAGTIHFTRVDVPYAQATTDCSVLTPITYNDSCCEGQVLMLEYSDPIVPPNVSYTWICPDGPTFTTTIPQLDRPNATSAMSGRYKLLRYSGTQRGDTIYSDLVVVGSYPQIELVDSGPEHCGLQDGFLAVSVTGDAAPFQYEWSPAMNATDTLVNLSSQDYTLTVTSSHGCSSTRTFTVDSLQIPIACFTIDSANSSFVVGETIVFDNCSRCQTDNYWDFGDGTSLSTLLNPTHSYNIAGTYRVQQIATGQQGFSADTMVKYVTVTEVGVEYYDSVQEENLRIHPNPASETLSIEVAGITIQEVSLFDLNGNLLSRISASDSQMQVDLTGFPAGTYLLKVKTVKGELTKKFVKK